MSTSELAIKPRLALFDLDHTLLPLDSDHGWGEFSIAIGWCDREEFGRQNDAFLTTIWPAVSTSPTMCALPRLPWSSAARLQPRLRTSASWTR